MSKFTQLIDRYLSDRMSAADKAEFEKQIKANPQLKAEVELQREVMRGVERYGMRQSARKGLKKASVKTKVVKWGIALAITAAVAAVAWVAKDKFSREHNNIRYELNEEGKKQWADADRNLTPQLFEINAEKDTVIETAGGVVIAIPAGAFYDKFGAEVKGNFEIEVKEALNPTDIMRAGLSTTSDGKLLETGGMFYINARKDGENLNPVQNKGLYVNVPANNKKEGMMLFEGKRLDNGQINWVKPQELENNLNTVDIMSLNFYPPNFLDSVKTFGFDVKNKKLTDSIYYSLECNTEVDHAQAQPAGKGDTAKASNSDFDGYSYVTYSDGNTIARTDSVRRTTSLKDKLKNGPVKSSGDGKTVFKQNCAVCHLLDDRRTTGPGLKGVSDRVPAGDWLFNFIRNAEKMIKSGDPYALKTFKEYAPTVMTVFEGTLSDEDIKAVIAYISSTPNISSSEISSCQIAPSRIRAIWDKKYNNTLLATHEFEERLQVIFNSCDAGVLKLYVNNLDKKMYELDELAAQMTAGKPECQHKFMDFASRKDGGVKVEAAHMKKLQEYFEEKRKLYHEATITAMQKMYEKEGRQALAAIERGIKHDSKDALRQQQALNEEIKVNMTEAYRQLGKENKVVSSPAPAYYSGSVINMGWHNVDAYVVEATVSRTTLDYTDPATGNKAVIKYEPFVVTVARSEQYERVYAYLLPRELTSFQRLSAETPGKFRENLNEIINYDLVVLGFKGKDIYFKQLLNVKPGEKSVTLDASNQMDVDFLLKSYSSSQRETDFTQELKYLALEQKENVRQRAIVKREEIAWRLKQVIYPCYVLEH